MGDNFLRQQVKNFRRGRDRAMREIESPALFARPDVVKTLFTAMPCSGKSFDVGESLLAVADNGSQRVIVLRGCERIGEIDGDSATVIRQALCDPSSPGVAAMQVVEVAELSGVAKVEIRENGGPT